MRVRTVVHCTLVGIYFLSRFYVLGIKLSPRYYNIFLQHVLFQVCLVLPTSCCTQVFATATTGLSTRLPPPQPTQTTTTQTTQGRRMPELGTSLPPPPPSQAHSSWSLTRTTPPNSQLWGLPLFSAATWGT